MDLSTFNSMVWPVDYSDFAHTLAKDSHRPLIWSQNLPMASFWKICGPILATALKFMCLSGILKTALTDETVNMLLETEIVGWLL